MSNALTTLTSKLAARFDMGDGQGVTEILKNTAFKVKDGAVSDNQMAALLVIANQYGLNPFTKEIYAYPDKSNGIVPVVGVDGWSRIINERPELDGLEFRYSEQTLTHKGKVAHEWIECVITRKDRKAPVVVREYFDEVVRNLNFATPWDTHPKRMHRHKVMIQCARLAFGFGGIYDQDEAERIVEKDMGSADVVDAGFNQQEAITEVNGAFSLDELAEIWQRRGAEASNAKDRAGYGELKKAVESKKSSLEEASKPIEGEIA